MFKAESRFELALAHHEQCYALERCEREARADMQSRILIHRAELDQARAAVQRSGLEATQQRQRAEALDRIAHLDALTVRQGGEEFLIVFVDTPIAQAADPCELCFVLRCKTMAGRPRRPASRSR